MYAYRHRSRATTDLKGVVFQTHDVMLTANLLERSRFQREENEKLLQTALVHRVLYREYRFSNREIDLKNARHDDNNTIAISGEVRISQSPSYNRLHNTSHTSHVQIHTLLLFFFIFLFSIEYPVKMDYRPVSHSPNDFGGNTG